MYLVRAGIAAFQLSKLGAAEGSLGSWTLSLPADFSLAELWPRYSSYLQRVDWPAAISAGAQTACVAALPSFAPEGYLPETFLVYIP